MKALVLREIKQPLQLEERPSLEPGEGQVVVAIRAAALNRRDYWITQGMYPGVQTPVILGSDGAGVVTKCGTGVASDLDGMDCIVNPGWDWGDNQRFQSESFRILGMPVDGTFATEVVVPAESVHAKPDHMDWFQAAALPLAAMTAYRAVVVQGQVQAGQRVLVTGVGGGVAVFALQFATSLGAEVLVTSSSSAKLERAASAGARAGFNYTSDGWSKQLASEHGQIDLIIDSAGGKGYADLLNLAAPGGRIVNYGATAGPPPKLDLFKLFWKQLQLIGTTMGSPADFRDMLTLVEEHQIVPVVDQILPLDRGNEALAMMEQTSQFGKLVLSTEG